MKSDLFLAYSWTKVIPLSRIWAIVSESHGIINVCGESDQFCKIPHTYIHLHMYIHTTYRMSDHIVSYWTHFRRDNKTQLASGKCILYLATLQSKTLISRPVYKGTTGSYMLKNALILKGIKAKSKGQLPSWPSSN